jgi:alanyl aminopeptidase
MRRMRSVIPLLLVACGSTAKPATTTPAPTTPVAPPITAPVADALVPPQPTVRLPRNFVPTGYKARLAIDPKKDKFSGAVEIAGNVSERSSVIWLHGFHLAITKAAASNAAGAIALTVTPKGEDLLEVRAEKPLDAGAWTLAFEYTGELDPVNTSGAFKQTVAGESYVFTQLEAIFARRVFPSFDEPNVKVPWKLTLDVPKALVAVANTPQESETALDANTKRVEFAVTKPLPTYLVAFGVGPFDIVDAGKSKRGTPLRMITLKGRSADVAYAAQTSPKILDAVEDYFGMPYPYEKLDMLTIPLTVGFLAMENAGLITYGESLMLMDPKDTSIGHKRFWILVAAHEVAHQWFGNLVTPEFWDDIWLNEGFATWLGIKIGDKLEPQWRDSEFAITMRTDALRADAIVSARKIRQPIDSLDDIRTAFDGITYQKGAAVLYMFENYLGVDTFQKGVREYLASRTWGNATSADFVGAIAKASGKQHIDTGFASFLDQAGSPEIVATPSCKAGKIEVQLAQKRYLPPGAPEPAQQQPWVVPVCIAFDKAGKRGEMCTLLDKANATIALDTKTCPRWVMPNATGRGYYRNAYTVPQLVALRDEAWSKLTWAERRVIQHDVATAARTGKLSLQLALSFTPKMLAGNDRFTVDAALGLPSGFSDFVPDDLRGKYEHWLRTQFGPAANAAGFMPKPSETLDLEITRVDLLNTVAWLGREPALIAEAVRLADRWRELPEAIRELVLTVAVDAKPEIYEKTLREVTMEKERNKRKEMFDALRATRDPVRYKAALQLILDPKVDIRESMWMVLGTQSDATREVAKQFVRDHKDSIIGRFPNAQVQGPIAQLATVFTGTCKAAEREAIAEYVTKTFASMAGGERTVKQAIEGMDQCIARKKILEPELRAWLGGVRIPKPDVKK